MRIILFSIFMFSLTFTIKAQNTRVEYLDAFASYEKSDYTGALKDFTALSEAKPKDQKILFYKALSQYHLSNYQEAVDLLKQVDENEIAGKDIWLAKSYAQLHMKNEAFNKLNSYLSSEKYTNHKIIQKDAAFDYLKSDARWFDLWQGGESEIEKTLNEEQFYADKKDYAKAVEVLESSGLQNEEIKIEKAKMYLELKKYSLGIAELNNCEEMDNKAEAYRIMSRLYLRLGEYQKALNTLNSLLDFKPEQFDAYRFRAEAQYNMGNYSEAEKDISLLQKYFNDDAEINLLAAKIYRENGNGLKSLEILNKLLGEDDSQPSYYIERAKTFARTGNHKFAVADYSMALDLDAENGETYYLKGLERIKMGDTEGACSDFRKAKLFGETRAVKEIIENGCN